MQQAGADSWVLDSAADRRGREQTPVFPAHGDQVQVVFVVIVKVFHMAPRTRPARHGAAAFCMRNLAMLLLAAFSAAEGGYKGSVDGAQDVSDRTSFQETINGNLVSLALFYLRKCILLSYYV